MNEFDFLIQIDGLATLWSYNNQFLGIISSDSYHPESIANEHGSYGNPYSPTSIFNNFGVYGSQWGIFSPYNSNALHPPAIIYQSQIVAIVTVNNRLYSDRTLIINPDLLRSAYLRHPPQTPRHQLINLYGDIHRRNAAFMASIATLGLDQP